MSLGGWAAESRRNPVVQSLEPPSGSKGTITSRSGGKKYVYGRAGQRPHVAWERVSVANPSESVSSVANPSESAPGEAERLAWPSDMESGPWCHGLATGNQAERGSQGKGQHGDTMTEDQATMLSIPPWLLGTLSSGKGRSVCLGGC